MARTPDIPEAKHRRGGKSATTPAEIKGLLLNQTINVFWSLIGFGPVSYYGYVYMFNRWFYIFLGLSLLALALPTSVVDALRLSRSAVFYRKAGLRWVQNFTQDGTLVNRILRKDAGASGFIQNRKTLQHHLNKGYVNEKFHLMLFVFFLLSTGYALVHQHFTWALAITLTNILYNVYPVLLQQYNRLRIRLLMKRY